jgi:hypothetical protein
MTDMTNRRSGGPDRAPARAGAQWRSAPAPSGARRNRLRGACVGRALGAFEDSTVDAAGHIVVADSENQALRRVSRAGEVSTLAGQHAGRQRGGGLRRRAGRCRALQLHSQRVRWRPTTTLTAWRWWPFGARVTKDSGRQCGMVA